MFRISFDTLLMSYVHQIHDPSDCNRCTLAWYEIFLPYLTVVYGALIYFHFCDSGIGVCVLLRQRKEFR